MDRDRLGYIGMEPCRYRCRLPANGVDPVGEAGLQAGNAAPAALAVDANRHCRHGRGEMSIIQRIGGAGLVVVCFQRVPFLLQRHTAVQNIPQDKPAIFWLLHAGDIGPVEALAVLGAHKRRID